MHPVLGEKRALLIYGVIWGSAALSHFLLLTYLLDGTWTTLAADAFLSNLLFALMALGFWYTCRALNPEETPLVVLLINHLGAAVLATLLWNGLVYAALRIISPGYLPTISGQLFSRALAGFLLYFLTIALYYIVIYYRRYHDKLLRESELRGLVQEAELQALKFQINPHFLFNSLNSLNALILTRPEDASRMTTKLADFLRATLASEESGLRALGEELKAARLYLEIEKVRFAERLIVEEEVAEHLLSVKVPAMILQPLFENAIKYGLQDSLEPVTIALAVYQDGDFMAVTIKNNHAGESEKRKGPGVGLRNIEERLKRFYPRHGRLAKVTRGADFFEVRIFIPLGGTSA